MQLILSKDSKKQFNRLPKSEQVKVRKKLTSLKNSSYSGKKLSGELSGQRSLRAWPYRIIYSVNEKLQRVEVNSIIHRQGAYG